MKPGVDFFRHASELDCVVHIGLAEYVTTTGLNISISLLNKLLGNNLSDQLLTRLGIKENPTVKAIEMPSSISLSLRRSISSALEGNIQKLFAQSKILEYLCTLVTHLEPSEITPHLSRKRRDELYQLREELLLMEGKVPNLNELAAHYRLSARTLNDQFKQLFGQPLYAFVSEHRLQQARVALVESDVQIKVLAARLGYSHPNHFSTAFKNKFGYAPGYLRKESLNHEADA